MVFVAATKMFSNISSFWVKHRICNRASLRNKYTPIFYKKINDLKKKEKNKTNWNFIISSGTSYNQNEYYEALFITKPYSIKTM